jgi:transposase InsO family protein
MDWLKVVKPQLRYNRDLEVRRKIELFVSAHKEGVAAACRRLGRKRGFYYFWWNRFLASGYRLESLQPRSRKPHGHRRQVAASTVEAIVRLRKKTAMGRYRLHHELALTGLVVPVSTIGKVLRREGLIGPPPRKKGKKSGRRFEMAEPGDMIQMDVKYVPWRIAGQRYYQYTVLDDCTRWRYTEIRADLSGTDARDVLEAAQARFPVAFRKVQTDNGVEFTYRLVSEARVVDREPKPHPFDIWCDRHNIAHRCIPPGAKTQQGKVERSHRMDQEEFYNLKEYRDPEQLKLEHARWNRHYNARRLHGGIGFIPPIKRLEQKLSTGCTGSM